MEERSHYFGVRKIRDYTKKDLDRLSFLYLNFAGELIASQRDGNEEQVEKEIYVAAPDQRQYSSIQFGVMMPFHGLCVTESLGQQLENAGLRGLSLEPVVFHPATRT